MRSIVKTIAVAIAAGAMLSSTNTPAAASEEGTANNYRTQFLTHAPTDGMANSYTRRSIYLAAGNYSYETGIFGVGATKRNLFLAAGTYDWNCTLDPKNGFYEVSCTIKKPGSALAGVGPAGIRLSASGSMTWGGSLVQL